jgi:hypothetical protein
MHGMMNFVDVAKYGRYQCWAVHPVRLARGATCDSLVLLWGLGGLAAVTVGWQK